MAITQPLSIQTDEEYIDLYIDFTYSKKTYQEYGEPLGLKAADLWRKVLLGEDMFKKRKASRTLKKDRLATKRIPTDDELYTKYIIEDKTQEVIAYEYGVSPTTVHYWLKDAEIKKYRDDE